MFWPDTSSPNVWAARARVATVRLEKRSDMSAPGLRARRGPRAVVGRAPLHLEGQADELGKAGAEAAAAAERQARRIGLLATLRGRPRRPLGERPQAGHRVGQCRLAGEQ